MSGVSTAGCMQHALRVVVVTDALRDRLGAALRSGRALFLYGPAGTGKTFIAARLRLALPGRDPHTARRARQWVGR